MNARLLRLMQFTMAASAAAVCGWSAYRGVVYLKTSPRFDVQKLSVSGLKHVQENEVLAKAGFELGTNLFQVELQEIREHIEELRWVRYALVRRVLPDQIVIKIVEREPVGLARIYGEVYAFDAEGTILEAGPTIASAFPILDGLRTGDPRRNLPKVEIYRKVIEDLGETTLSEVHIADSGEVTVVSASDPLMINLGDGDFRNRWIKYLQLKPQIQQQFPDAVRVDLRFRNQVIVKVKDDETDGMVVWGEKKNTL
jgi:cell division septal protein FtsQ